MVANIIDIGYVPPVKHKVLVVDDEVELQTLIFDTLEADYQVVPAYNGREGVQKASNLQPAVILMDIKMPDIGGYEAVRLLQDDPTTREIPVIVVTGQNFDQSTVEMIRREPNVATFISKPFRPNQLRAAVRLALSRKKDS